MEEWGRFLPASGLFSPVHQVNFDTAVTVELVDDGPVRNLDRAVVLVQRFAPIRRTEGDAADHAFALFQTHGQVVFAGSLS